MPAEIWNEPPTQDSSDFFTLNRKMSRAGTTQSSFSLCTAGIPIWAAKAAMAVWTQSIPYIPLTAARSVGAIRCAWKIALPGHKFKVVSLDGNAVPGPREVDVIEMGPAERADAVVTMNQPGVWILGETDDQVQNAGLGIVVEYANRSEAPRWTAPANTLWDYTAFGRGADTSEPPGGVVPLVFRKKFAGNRWVDHWTINGKSFPKTDPIRVRKLSVSPSLR
jgi:hypothetical protein